MEKVDHVSEHRSDVAQAGDVAEPGIGRTLGASGVTIALTALLTLLGAGMFRLGDGEGALTAFLDAGPRLVWSTLWVTFPVWALLVVAAGIRWRQATGPRAFTTILIITLACAGLTTLGWFVVALVEGGWALLLVAISLMTASLFAVAATISAAVAHLWWFRP